MNKIQQDAIASQKRSHCRLWQIIGDGHLQANLKNIASHPHYRGQGIASNIVRALILDVPNCDVIRAETSRAKVLYEKLSFTEYSGDVMELIR